MLFQHIPKCRSTHIQPPGSLALIIIFLLQNKSDNIVLDICKALLKVDWVISRSVVGCAAAWLLSLNNLLNAYTVNVGTICLDD